MLDDESLLHVVQPAVEVCDGDLHSPVVLVVDLHVPVHADGAHVVGALQQRGVVFSRRVHPAHAQKLGVATAISIIRFIDKFIENMHEIDGD